MGVIVITTIKFYQKLTKHDDVCCIFAWFFIHKLLENALLMYPVKPLSLLVLPVSVPKFIFNFLDPGFLID